MIDLHTHVLPGIDDGARTLDDSLEMARAFVADGVTEIAATPHVRVDYPTSADAMLAAVDLLRRAFEEAAIPLVVHAGAELDVEWMARLPEAEIARLTLAGGRYVLVETPYRGWRIEVVEQLLRLRRAGFTPVLAHPERNAIVQERPSVVEPLVRGGTLVQVTTASLDGRLGRRPQESARGLLSAELVHLVASDAHTPEVRAAGMRAALEALDDDALARWLAFDVPRALVENRDVPARPPVD